MGLLRLVYHYLLAILGAGLYRFPSRRLYVIGVTGTKGKTSVCELVSALLEAGGYRTAISSTLRFKIGPHNYPNRLKMTTPGRFFLQKFLRQAVTANCTHAIIEMSSEGARQFRHRFIAWNALILTNLAPEHIESHGSYEKYLAAKLSIAQALARSAKPEPLLIINGDDAEAEKFLAVPVKNKVVYHLTDTAPYRLETHGAVLTIAGEKIVTRLPGEFNIYNVLAAITLARAQSVSLAAIRHALDKFSGIRGRMEQIGWQDFEVIVDYAHTPESLRQAYQTKPDARKICVLGSAGGGRDRWKRPTLGQIADKHCYQIILTNEDPYDEDPEQIVRDIAAGIKHRDHQIILDRRLAIREALQRARSGDVVFITGKGTDPYIMGPRGTKTPWSDAQVAHEELEKFKNSKEGPRK